MSVIVYQNIDNPEVPIIIDEDYVSKNPQMFDRAEIIDSDTFEALASTYPHLDPQTTYIIRGNFPVSHVQLVGKVNLFRAKLQAILVQVTYTDSTDYYRQWNIMRDLYGLFDDVYGRSEYFSKGQWSSKMNLNETFHYDGAASSSTTTKPESTACGKIVNGYKFNYHVVDSVTIDICRKILNIIGNPTEVGAWNGSDFLAVTVDPEHRCGVYNKLIPSEYFDLKESKILETGPYVFVEHNREYVGYLDEFIGFDCAYLNSPDFGITGSALVYSLSEYSDMDRKRYFPITITNYDRSDCKDFIISEDLFELNHELATLAKFRVIDEGADIDIPVFNHARFDEIVHTIHKIFELHNNAKYTCTLAGIKKWELRSAGRRVVQIYLSSKQQVLNNHLPPVRGFYSDGKLLITASCKFSNLRKVITSCTYFNSKKSLPIKIITKYWGRGFDIKLGQDISRQLKCYLQTKYGHDIKNLYIPRNIILYDMFSY
jgi:hypothetical protein